MTEARKGKVIEWLITALLISVLLNIASCDIYEKRLKHAREMIEIHKKHADYWQEDSEKNFDHFMRAIR